MKSLRDRIAQIYYTHGLFCSSHPITIIIVVIGVICLVCYPLTNLPLPGNVPLHFEVPLNEYKDVPISTPTTKGRQLKEDELKKPRWLVGEPVGFVQQIVVKATVSPWKPEILIPTDAFRGPLGKVYEILEYIENFRYSERGKEYAISDLCLRVSETLSWHKVKHYLPEYGCLIVSPANLWQKDPVKFNTDAEIMKTIYKKFGNTIESPPAVKDILFGLPWKQTGVSRYFIRNRQRTISYAITIITKKYYPQLMIGLKKRLEGLYPETGKNVNNSEVDFMVNVHYRDINFFVEYTPLLVTYFVLLMYIYFSVRKIEMVKSKIGLAISAVSTVIASLFMSVSICAFFGLTPTLNGGEIFPYLVIIIGLENVVVLTKSVVSTPVHLDVKVRVAQGLSKEGWFITKNLVTELAILLVGFFTFVPAIQEFCLFAVVGLLSDFFLQMVFFTTVLSVDIRRMELLDLHKQSIHRVVESDQSPETIEPLIRCPVMSRLPPSPVPSLNRSVSAPRLDGTGDAHTPPASPLFPRLQPADAFFQHLELPRRLKLFFFLSKTRIFQRMIMVCTVAWIALIMYKSGLVDKLTSPDGSSSSGGPATSGFEQIVKGGLYSDKNRLNAVEEALGGGKTYEDKVGPVEHTNVQQWQQLYFKHWPKLFGYYNISLWGRYITMLPSIHLSIVIDPETAVSIRHPSERNYYVVPRYSSQSITDNISSEGKSVSQDKNVTYHIPYYMDPEQLKQFYPRSQKELVITVCLAFLSVIVISYFMVVLYKCLCSRNYSKWRSSWSKRGRRRKGYIKHIKETVPLVLRGHNQTIDCLVTDGPLVISSCWGGQLRIWDSNTGECITSICRKSFTPPQRRKPCLGRNIEDSEADLYEEYHGDIKYLDIKSAYDDKIKPRPYSDIKPDLTGTINTEFSSIEPRFVASAGGTRSGKMDGYDFHGLFNGVYEEHRRSMAVDAVGHDQRLHSAGEVMPLSEVQARNRSWSAGDATSDISEELFDPSAEIWCLACQDGLVVAGCKNGHIEFWEADTGIMKGQYDSGVSSVMGLCFVGNRVVAGRLDGTLDFLELETFRNPVTLSVPTATPTRQMKGHSRHYSHGSRLTGELKLWDEVIHCNCVQTSQAHQRPINVLKTEGGRVVSASQDHTLKVFRLEDCLCLYTLHGHLGNVTALCLDKCPPYAAASGSDDGAVRLWDLLTGTCVYDFKGHDGSIVTLTATLYYIISLGLDDKVCIWERNRGQLLHSLEMEQCYCCSLSLLTSNLLVTGGQGTIYLWDLTKGELLRKVKIDDSDNAAFVYHLKVVGNMGVACDLGTDIKVVHFPTILEKAE